MNTHFTGEENTAPENEMLYSHEFDGLLSYDSKYPHYENTELYFSGRIPATRARQQVFVVVKDGAELPDGWANALDALLQVSQAVTDIPEEYRSGAFIRFESRGDSEDRYPPEFTVGYWRPEIDHEFVWRMALLDKLAQLQAAKRKAALDRERALFESLKKKFGPTEAAAQSPTDEGQQS